MNMTPTHLIKKKKVTEFIDGVPISYILPVQQAETLYNKLIAKGYVASIEDVIYEQT